MMTLKDLLRVLDTIAPFDTAEEWDNVGLMVGDPDSEIRSILVALDPSRGAIEAAMGSAADLLLTHHPLMIRPVRRFDISEGAAKKMAMLIRSGIALVSMHTNLDKAPGGVADELAACLGLKDVRSLGVLRVGSITTPAPLARWIGTLPLKGARVIDAGVPVHRVGACPGSGMDFWRLARREGCDTMVTGDVRYHAGTEALDAGLNVVDLGHFGTEEIIVAPLADRLRQKLIGIDVRAYRANDIFSLYHE